MKNITTILLAGTASVVMSACGGGGGGSSDPVAPISPSDPVVVDTIVVGEMNSKDGVAIAYHYPVEACKSDLLINELQTTVPNAENFLIQVASNDVTCATYDKTEGVDCHAEDSALIDPSYAQYDTSCVIGFDLAVGTTSSIQIMEDTALAAEFTLDAL